MTQDMKVHYGESCIMPIPAVWIVCRYAIVWEKGYQEMDPVVSVALTKVKGVWYTEMKKDMPGISNRTWDVADYVVPPEVP